MRRKVTLSLTNFSWDCRSLEHDVDVLILPRVDPADQSQCADLEANAEEVTQQGM
jgi:hypothetical protein